MNLRTVASLALLMIFWVHPIRGREVRATATAQDAPTAYPNSAQGLQNEIEDILTAIKEKNSSKETDLIHSLLMPNDSTWFIDEYGPGFGASLAAAYRRAVPNLEQEIKATYEANVLGGHGHPKILRYADPEAVNAPIDHFLNSMNHIVPLYETAFLGERPMFQIPLKLNARKVIAGDLNGYFAYVDGGFRFIPADVLMRLPNERPVRIHLDMNVMKSKLIVQTYPGYPEEAMKKHIGGKVVVHLNLGTDGKIQDAKALSRDPVLSQALLNATKQ